MQIFNITNAAVYLPADKSQVPFGDPINNAAITLASPGVATVQGYTPTNGDALYFTLPVGGSGVLPAAIVAGTTYYVVGASGATFNLAATKGGAAINTAQAASGTITTHILGQVVYGTLCPFKTSATVVVENNTAGPLTLQGAADANQAAAGTNTYNPPSVPGSFSTIVTVPANGRALAQLNFDWIRVSTAATLTLVQN